jgi:hypothetical protein
MMRTGALAWLLVAGLAAATLAGTGREHARAEGAIAVGTTGNVEKYGIAFGMALNESKGKAGEIAVLRCRTFEAKEAAERCKVVATFYGECLAIAYDPKPGTPGAGWGVGPDQLAANQLAVAMCEKAAGPARKGYCQVERFGCDTTKPTLDTKPAPGADAKPVPGTDAKVAPDTKEAEGVAKATEEAKDATKDVKVTEEAKDATKDVKAAEEAKDATKDVKPAEEAKDTTKDVKPAEEAKVTKKVQDPKEDKPGQAHTVSVAPPPSFAPPAPKPRTAAEPAQSKTRNPATPLLPVLALAGVGLAYAVGQHLRGRLKDGVAERQIITGGALAVAAAIAVKLVDMTGASATVAAALAGLIALGAAFLA